MTETINQQGVATDELVRKIQLLLNLAARSEGNEQEAAAAMGKAQELLAKYNLDIATVQDAATSAGNKNLSAADAKREKVEGKRNATYEWTRDLVKAIAEANYCVYWAADVRVENKNGDSRWIKRHRVLGRVENTTAVLVMADYLYGTIMRLLPYDKSSWLSKDALAWCEGCVERLTERIKAKAEAMRTPDYATQGEQGFSTAIMVRNMAESERIANYDAINGKGAWARKLATDAKYEAERPIREARWALEAQAIRNREAAKLLAETPEEKAKRLRREAKEARASEAYSRSYWNREDRKTEREQSKRSSHAFRSGAETGDSIGLDSQVGTTDQKGLR